MEDQRFVVLSDHEKLAAIVNIEEVSFSNLECKQQVKKIFLMAYHSTIADVEMVKSEISLFRFEVSRSLFAFVIYVGKPDLCIISVCYFHSSSESK